MEQRFSLEELNNVSEIDIVYRRKVTCKMSERPQITSSKDAYEIFKHYWNSDRIDLLEEFKVIFLNRSCRVLQIIQLFQGGISGTVADTRLILAAALKLGSSSMIIAHNHPSTNLQPSNADIELTKKIKCAADYHDIKLQDHIILSSEGYLSLADEGLL